MTATDTLPGQDLRGLRAIIPIADAALRVDAEMSAVLALAAFGPEGAAIASTVGALLPHLAGLAAVGMKLAERNDAARAGAHHFLGDPAPLGAARITAEAEMAIDAVGRPWRTLAAAAMAEVERAERGQRTALRAAEQLAAAVLCIRRHFAAPAVLAAMRDGGPHGLRLALVLGDLAPAGTRYLDVLREVRQRLGRPRWRRRLFARDRAAPGAVAATRALLDAFGQFGGIVAEAFAEATVEGVTLDKMFAALAAGLRPSPLP